MTTELEALAARVARIEDELAIRRVILTYGPAADAGETARAGALWADDGAYDWDAERPALQGPDAVAAMLQGEGHQSLIARGVAHFAGPPLIEVDGDRATALSYSFVLRRDDDQRVYVWRLGAARWEFGSARRLIQRSRTSPHGSPQPRGGFARTFDCTQPV